MFCSKIKVIAVYISWMAMYILLCQCKSSVNSPGDKSSQGPAVQDTSSVMTMPEVAPRFPGCEGLATMEEKKKCADKKLLEYVYTHIQYPEYAKANDVQGRCVLSFIVEKDGRISNPKIIKDIGGGCGEASLHVVNTFNDMKDRWIPGIEKGSAIRALYYLPVNFRLEPNPAK